MKTDRELLELAAKAYGIKGEWVSSYGSGDYYYQGNPDGIYYEHDKGGFSVWNPLTDDGDALRLAVKLDMKVYVGEAYPFSKNTATYALGACCDEDECADPYAATRRAIVRAAAAIGEGMK